MALPWGSFPSLWSVVVHHDTRRGCDFRTTLVALEFIQNDGFSMWMLYKAVFLESDSESSNSTLCSLRPGKEKETSLLGTE